MNNLEFHIEIIEVNNRRKEMPSIVESFNNCDVIEEKKKIVENDCVIPKERVKELFEKFYTEFKETFDELKDR